MIQAGLKMETFTITFADGSELVKAVKQMFQREKFRYSAILEFSFTKRHPRLTRIFYVDLISKGGYSDELL
jgi:hypothetical protein